MNIDFKTLKDELSKNPGILLDELAKKIGKSFWIQSEVIKKLLQNEANESLSSLKKELLKDEGNKNTELSDEQLDSLLAVISWWKELIQQLSKKEIEELKEELSHFTPENAFVERFFSKNLVLRAKNPQFFPDHISWACLWILNSTEKLIHLLFLLWKGMVQAPFHIYLIVSGKWECESFSKI